VSELIPWLSKPLRPAPENVRSFRFNPDPQGCGLPASALSTVPRILLTFRQWRSPTRLLYSRACSTIKLLAGNGIDDTNLPCQVPR